MDKDAKKNDKPVIQIFGNVEQKDVDAKVAEAKAAAAAIAEITAPVLMETATLQDVQNSMHKFYYLLQRRQTHQYCLHLQLGVRKNSKSRKERASSMRKVAGLNLQRVASQNLRKVAKIRKVAKMTKVARMRQRENSKMNSKERKETKGSRVKKDLHSLLPKLLVRSVHASPKSLRRLWKAIRTKCMTLVP